MYKRVYIEITNICNLNCSFCPGTVRPKHFMTAGEFRIVAEKVRPLTDYIYLHVMGEPLLHPDFENIVNIASELGFRINITTNGTLIDRHEAFLLSAPSIRKISVSLHSFEGNNMTGSSVPQVSVSLHSYEGNNMTSPREYLEKIWSFCEKAEYIVALRLWNDGGADKLNRCIFDFLSEKTGLDVAALPSDANGRRLTQHIYLENAAKFDWPSTVKNERNVSFCHGLTGQFAVLCDGTVVPCCLDSDGAVALGNIFIEDISSILQSDRAERMRQGFIDHHPTEELCRHCGYAERFG